MKVTPLIIAILGRLSNCLKSHIRKKSRVVVLFVWGKETSFVYKKETWKWHGYTLQTSHMVTDWASLPKFYPVGGCYFI